MSGFVDKIPACERSGVEITSESRLPYAAWAWQGLRRNKDYREEYFVHDGCAPAVSKLASGANLLTAKQRCKAAEQFGLLCFANPNKSAVDANVFWRPDLLAGALRVHLAPYDLGDDVTDEVHDIIVLSGLKARRVMLDAADGVRHILLVGQRFWVHLFAHPPYPKSDDSIGRIRIDEAKHGMRRLDTAAQLLSLHRSTGQKLSLIGRRREPSSLVRALAAYDIWHGFERPKGGLEDVAAMITGAKRMADHWDANDRNLRVQARRWVKRGEDFVSRGYLDYLTRKTL